MQTDLFLAIQDKKNGRNHPILAALLYVYCPMAARWWLAGADPQPPFDPVWQAMIDRLSGKSLKEKLEEFGFSSLILESKAYIKEVEAFRRVHPGIPSPELLPIFSGGQTGVRQRVGQYQAIERLGKDWHNLFKYSRTWAFLIDDWERKMKFFAPPTRRQISLPLIVKATPKNGQKEWDVKKPLFWPAWEWTASLENKTRIVIGLFTDGPIDPLRYTLAQRAGSPDKDPWKTATEVFVLNRITGEAEPFVSQLEYGHLIKVVESLAQKAEAGPHTPLRALQDPADCLVNCGYTAQCFTGKPEPRMITSLALGI